MGLLPVLLLSLSVVQNQASDPRAEAERLARAGEYAEALQRFQGLVAANPDDIESRLWIGRLHIRMGNAARAAAVFESITSSAPQKVEAWVGLGTALMDAGRWAEAANALNRAEALAADRTDVLAAQGRYHGATGHAALALAYYDRAMVAAPDDDALRAEADALRASRAHRIELGYAFQGYDPAAGEVHAGSVLANLRVSDTLRVFAGAQAQDFEGVRDTRGGGGFEWQAHPSVRLRAGAFVGDTVWLPQTDVFVETGFSGRRVQWSVEGRYVDFDGGDIWLFGPGVVVPVTDRVRILGQYLFSRTAFDSSRAGTGDGNGLLGVEASLTERLVLAASYRRGLEELDWFTADRFTASDANTYAMEAGFGVTPRVGLKGAYAYQDRTGRFAAHRARARLVIRF